MNRFVPYVVIMFVVQSCATYKPQYDYSKTEEASVIFGKIEHTFFLVGDP
jgi:hypothetical protein